MKDLSSPKYWASFGDLGPAMGRNNMPSPQEAAETVLRLMRERDEAIELAEEARGKARALLTQVDTFLLKVSNEAAELGYGMRNEAKLSNTAMGAKLRDIRQRAIDGGMELQPAADILRDHDQEEGNGQ